MEDEVGLVLIDYEGDEEVNKYVITGVIGNAADGGRVYKAEWSDSWSKDMTAAMRFAKVSDAAEVEKLKSAVAEYDRVEWKPHLLWCMKVFYYKDYFCAPFPYMKHGSLLTLMADRFPAGLPEPCIVHLLHRFLVVLRALQCSNVSHGRICAAHVYLVQLPSGFIDIVVGYAVTLHDLAVDENVMRRPALAAAPDLISSFKADVWQVGITALELAYGGLHFCSRGDLESLINNIHDHHQLPERLEHEERWRWLKERAACLPSSLNTNKRRALARFQGKGKGKGRLFSKPFIRFLVDCLHSDPAKRPHVIQLMQCRLFDEFRDAPLINLSPYYDHAQWMIRNHISNEARF